MWSNNASSDPLVDSESCLTLGISSVIAVPLVHADRVIGLIDVFSRDSYAFDTSDCFGLEAIAKKVAASVGGKGWLRNSRDNQHTEVIQKSEFGLLTTQTEASLATAAITLESASVAIDSPTNRTVDQRLLSASTLSPAGYKFSLREKVMLHQRTVLWSAGAVLLAASLLLGIGRSRQFREAQLGASQNVSRPANLPTSAVSLPTWLADVRHRADQGDPDAELKLGAAYANGQNGVPNYTESAKWLMRSADHGNVTAAAVLGAFDWAGRGGTQGGYVDAYMWSAIAQAQGDQASSYRVSILQSRMSPAESAEAKRRAAAWLRAHHQGSVRRKGPIQH
jgi:hypothetical protein